MSREVLIYEWRKLRSVRSTPWTMGFAVLAGVLVSVILGVVDASQWATFTAGQRADFDPVASSLAGGTIGQLGFGVLGVLCMSSEYATGMIRTTFAAVPHRRRVLMAKAVVVGTLALAIGEGLAFASFLTGQAALTGSGAAVSTGDPAVLRAVACGGAYMAIITLVGLGLGTIVRRTPEAIALLFGLTFVIPELVHSMPSPWDNSVGKYMLSNAGTQAASLRLDPHWLSPGVSLLVCGFYAATSLLIGALLIGRRDA